MKVGSIVECVNDRWVDMIPGVTYPRKNQPYIIRSIRPCVTPQYKGRNSILLEEITNPIVEPYGVEFGFLIERFRELLPPMEIQSALDECEPILIER